MATPTIPTIALPTAQTAQPTQPPQPAAPEQELVPLGKSQISYDEYTNNRLTCTPPEVKTVPGTGGSTGVTAVTYRQVGLQYNYGSNEKKMLGDLLMEYPEMTSKWGIQSKKDQNGKWSYTLVPEIDQNVPEYVKLKDTLDQVHSATAFILQHYRSVLNMHAFEAAFAEAGKYKKLWSYQQNKDTKERYMDKPPVVWLRLFKRGQAPYEVKTMFVDPSGNSIPWESLQKVEIKFIPIMRFKHIYVGNTPSLIVETDSCIITSIKPRNVATSHLGVLARLRSANPDLADNVASQLARLTAQRQDQLLDKAEEKNEEHGQQQGGATEGDQPTFSGIARVPGALPSIPAIPTGASMHDMTASAPLRVPVGTIQLS